VTDSDRDGHCQSNGTQKPGLVTHSVASDRGAQRPGVAATANNGPTQRPGVAATATTGPTQRPGPVSYRPPMPPYYTPVRPPGTSDSDAGDGVPEYSVLVHTRPNGGHPSWGALVAL
jgi:hypothetical protein